MNLKNISTYKFYQDGFKLVELGSFDAEDLHKLYKTYRVKPYSISKIQNILSDMPNVGIRANGELIAFCYTEFFAPEIIELGSIFVASKYRKQGIGKFLLSVMKEKIKQDGYEAIILSNSMLYETKEPKRRARNFYLDSGYELITSTKNTDVFVMKL